MATTSQIRNVIRREEQVAEPESRHCSQALPVPSEQLHRDFPEEQGPSTWRAHRPFHSCRVPSKRLSTCSQHAVDQGSTKAGCQEVCTFIDIPEDEVLAQLVSKVQKHRHSATCRRNGCCRFRYPRPPSPATVIAHEANTDLCSAEDAAAALLKVRKTLDDVTSPDSISLEELLVKAGVSEDAYRRSAPRETAL